jgi:hypothetical protein
LLARIWGQIRFEHPFLFDRDVDWDGALSEAIPTVASAPDEDAEAAAVGAMLAALHDPLTRVDAVSPGARSGGDGPTLAIRLAGEVTVVTLGALHTPRDSADAVKRVADALPTATSVVLDLRGPTDQTSYFGAAGATEGLAPALVARDVSPPGHRWIQHEGFAPRRGATGGGFRTYFATEAVLTYRAVPGKHRPSKVAFVVDASIGVPPLVAAMQRSGDAVVVAVGDVEARAAVGGADIPLGTHHVVRIRDSESLDGDWEPDARARDAASAVDLAIEVLARPRARRGEARTPLAEAHVVHDATYATEALPSREHRLLAAFRLWNAIRLFHPYLSLLDAPWDDALTDTIPRFEAAEGAARDGLDVGDVILGVGSEPFDARAARVGAYVASSNAWTHARDSDDRALFCQSGAPIELRVRDPQDAVRTVTTTCRAWTPPAQKEPPYRKLEDAIGYVDLDRLREPEVGAMFGALDATRAIVFDMRGYPRGATLALAQRLNLPGDVYVAFSGDDIRHADGRQLQRVGIAPDVLVRPTLKGIREGRDEVLERAVAYVHEHHDSKKPHSIDKRARRWIHRAGRRCGHAGRTTHRTGRRTHHAGRTTHHAGRRTHHAGRRTHHAGRTTHHAGRRAHHAGRRAHHAGRRAHHAGRTTPHAGR